MGQEEEKDGRRKKRIRIEGWKNNEDGEARGREGWKEEKKNQN